MVTNAGGRCARDKVLRDLKARTKVRMKHFNVKMTRVCGYQLALESFRCSKVLIGYKPRNNVMILYLEDKQYVCNFHQCVKRVECFMYYDPKLFICLKKSSKLLLMI